MKHLYLSLISIVFFAGCASTQTEPDNRRWLAGDHHIHSYHSVGWSEDNPPKPIQGGDAKYPIFKNAEMARQFGLEWIVATDHGGPNHSKLNLETAYPELLVSRQQVPEVIQFFGLELNSPGADHSSIIVPHSHDEAEKLATYEARFDSREAWPLDSERNTEPKMLEALEFADQMVPKPVVIAHHPSRSAPKLGEYGYTTPRELRAWNDTAPQVAVGMEGAPGHQAAAFVQSKDPRYPAWVYARGAYGRGYPTLGGYDQMTAQLGGFWDSMLAEGRRWWITANSDSHIHYTEGGIDFWPGEYSKTYVYAEKNHEDILDGIRHGRVFVTTGDLIDELYVSALSGNGQAGMGGELQSELGETVELTIRLRDPVGSSHGEKDPSVARVDLIVGKVIGPHDAADTHTHAETRVIKRFTSEDWRVEGEYRVMTFPLSVDGALFVRVRGTNTDQAEPLPDELGEDPWGDLWFYSNPLFISTR